MSESSCEHWYSKHYRYVANESPFNMVAEPGGSTRLLRRPDEGGGLGPGYERQVLRERARFHYDRRQLRRQVRGQERILEEICEMNKKFDNIMKEVRVAMSISKTSKQLEEFATNFDEEISNLVKPKNFEENHEKDKSFEEKHIKEFDEAAKPQIDTDSEQNEIQTFDIFAMPKDFREEICEAVDREIRDFEIAAKWNIFCSIEDELRESDVQLSKVKKMLHDVFRKMKNFEDIDTTTDYVREISNRLYRFMAENIEHQLREDIGFEQFGSEQGFDAWMQMRRLMLWKVSRARSSNTTSLKAASERTSDEVIVEDLEGQRPKELNSSLSSTSAKERNAKERSSNRSGLRERTSSSNLSSVRAVSMISTTLSTKRLASSRMTGSRLS